METRSTQAAFAAVNQLISWNRFKEALTEAEQLLRENPESADVLALVARIYFLLDDYDKALYWCNECTKREPEHRRGWFIRILTFYDSGRIKEFKQWIDEAIRIDPYESYYYYFKGNVHSMDGKLEEGRHLLLQALEIKPEMPIYLATLSYFEAKLGNKPESVRLDKIAIGYEPENPVVLLKLNWAAGIRGEYDLQLKYMREAIRLNPDDKQFQQEYLSALQNSHIFYRICLLPAKIMRELKPWQAIMLWMTAAVLFRPLLILFLLYYILTHWLTKALVHVKVFGWRRRGS